MATHAMFDNIETAKRNFVRNGLPFYVVVDTKNEILWKNEEESDLEAAADLLREDLSLIREYNTAIYTIRQFKKVPNGGLKKTTDPDCISTYKKTTPQEDRQEFFQARNYQMAGLNDSILSIKNEIASLKAEMSGDSSQDSDFDLEQEMEEIPWYHKLGETVVSHPQFGNFLTNIMANITTLLFNNQPPAAPQALAGTTKQLMTPEEQQKALQDAINTLFSKGVTVEHIQKLADMPAVKIKSLLMML